MPQIISNSAENAQIISQEKEGSTNNMEANPF